MNQIEVLPKALLVAQHEFWKKKDTSKIEDFVEVKAVADWTFSTPYKGSLSFISKEVEKIKRFTDLSVAFSAEAVANSTLKVEVT